MGTSQSMHYVRGPWETMAVFEAEWLTQPRRELNPQPLYSEPGTYKIQELPCGIGVAGNP